jgi:hypothetical protein
MPLRKKKITKKKWFTEIHALDFFFAKIVTKCQLTSVGAEILLYSTQRKIKTISVFVKM